MTREEAEALIAAEARSQLGCGEEILRLARLGAKVMAPTEDEISKAIRAFFDFDGGNRNRMRAALSALQEPKP